MLYRGQRIDKKQTKIVEKSRDPMFDETLEFSLLNILQLAQPMDNVGFESADIAADKSAIEQMDIDSRIASRIQFIILVMDWDQVEKSDVLGKIELNTQHHQQRLINCQYLHNSDQYKSRNSYFHNDVFRFDEKETVLDENFNKSTTSNDSFKTKQQNWYDIFYQPNMPILCTLQIKNY